MLAYLAALQISALRPTEGHEPELPWLGTTLSLSSRKAVALLSLQRGWASGLCPERYCATAFQLCTCLGISVVDPSPPLPRSSGLGEPSAELR